MVKCKTEEKNNTISLKLRSHPFCIKEHEKIVLSLSVHDIFFMCIHFQVETKF